MMYHNVYICYSHTHVMYTAILLLANLLLTLITIIITDILTTTRTISGHTILVIGGTSGLGLSLALKLSNHNHVTVSGRHAYDCTYNNMAYIAMDVRARIQHALGQYDVIVYCAGYACAKYFVDVGEDDVVDGMDVNYFGAVRVLRNIVMGRTSGVINNGNNDNGNSKGNGNSNNSNRSNDNINSNNDNIANTISNININNNTDIANINISNDTSNTISNSRPITVVLIGTPLTFFAIPGYAAYTPAKSALFALFTTIRPELLKIGIHLTFYILSTTYSPGYDKESATKPSYTQYVEQYARGASCDDRADVLISGLCSGRHVVCSDVMCGMVRGYVYGSVWDVVLAWMGSVWMYMFGMYCEHTFKTY